MGGYENDLSLEHAIKLSDALRLNNIDNGNSQIERFSLADNFYNVESFQIIWNTILVTSVPCIELSPTFLENRVLENRDDGGDNNNNNNINNNNINFTGLSTNTSMTRLTFFGFGMSLQNWRNLFISMKGNTGLERLYIGNRTYRSQLHNTEIVACFEEMLRKNITLIDVDALFDNDDNEPICINMNTVITIETKLNRKWNQYLMKRKEEEEKTASTIATPPPPPPPPPTHLVAAAAERKRRCKMK